jgi:hypothetical protein
MLPTKFQFIWESRFRGEDSLEINQSETRMACVVGSILGRSFINNANLVPIRLQKWPPHAIFVSDWLISKNSSETALPNESKLGFVNGSRRNYQSL